MIQLQRVSVTYAGHGERRDVRAVVDLDLELSRGESMCLIGPSGCGKTTTLRLMNRMLDASKGQVLVGGVDVTTMDPILLRRRIGYVIQSGGLFPHLNVEENIGLLGRIEGWGDSEIRSRVDELLEMVRLEASKFRGRFPGELSGGQRQRVGVARALLLEPEMLLMDEPFGALDSITRTELQGEFIELMERVEKTVVIVTHDLSEAFRLGNRIGVMIEGRLARLGTAQELRSDPGSSEVAGYLQQGHHGL